MIGGRAKFPVGIEVLMKKAAVDPEFRALLLERRADAAQAIGLELNPVEAAMLAAIPGGQMELIIDQTEVPEPSRRAFMGKAAAAMIAALGMGTTGCSLFRGHTADGVTKERDGMWAPSAGIRARPLEPPSLKTVHFDYDQSVIRPDQIRALDQSLEAIKWKYGGKMIVIEGHTDERGATEYNFALGERRAVAVRDYLVRNGVAAERLIILSKGKEQPADPGHDEAAWAKNRRVEFRVSGTAARSE